MGLHRILGIQGQEHRVGEVIAQVTIMTKRSTTTQGSYSNTGTYYKVQHCISLITRLVHIKGEHAQDDYSKGPAMEELQGQCFHKISE